MNTFHSLAHSGTHDGDTSIPSMPGIPQNLTDDEQVLLSAIVDFFIKQTEQSIDVLSLLQSKVRSSLTEQEEDKLSLSLRNIYQQLETIYTYYQHPETLNDSHQLHLMLTYVSEMVQQADVHQKLILPL